MALRKPPFSSSSRGIERYVHVSDAATVFKDFAKARWNGRSLELAYQLVALCDARMTDTGWIPNELETRVLQSARTRIAASQDMTTRLARRDYEKD